MTREEQNQLQRLDDKLDDLIRETAKSSGQTGEALKGIDKRLDGMDASITLIREAQKQNGVDGARTAADVNAINVRCHERGRAIEAMQKQIRRLVHHHTDEGMAASSTFSDVTPPPFEVPIQPPQESFWDWVHKRAGALVQILVLLGMIGTMAYWAFRTHQTMEQTHAALRKVTDSGAMPQ